MQDTGTNVRKWRKNLLKISPTIVTSLHLQLPVQEWLKIITLKFFTDTVQHHKAKSVQKNIYELSEFLVNVLKITDLGAKLEGKATYHDSCSALREMGIKKEPRILLENVSGLELIEMNETESCCGFGGTFSVKYEAIAVGMAEQKIINAEASEADILISTDVSCLMHLDGYLKKQKKTMRVMHIADVLASGW